jgi:hypothetical protein
MSTAVLPYFLLTNLVRREEADMLISLLNCFVPEREAVFASSEFFTGKKFYDLCLENAVRTPEELEKKLGPEYKNGLLTKNKEQGRSFAHKLRELGHKIVLTRDAPRHPSRQVTWHPHPREQARAPYAPQRLAPEQPQNRPTL